MAHNTIAVLTELDAVNQMLDSIDEAPVNSLASDVPDAEKAERVLDQVRREVLAKGWNSNTERELTITRDGSDNLIVGADVLRVVTTGTDKATHVSVRMNGTQRMLYDIKNRTFVWTKDLKVNVIYVYDFEDLNPELQMYIAALAARKFQQSTMGSVALDSFVKESEADAWAALQDAEAEVTDGNCLTDSLHCFTIAYRNSPLFGS